MIVLFGGTGTLGHAIAELVHKSKGTCAIVSRCELRQKAMQKLHPNFKYIIGDVTNTDWADQLEGSYIEYVFNLAAMKHVEIGEANVRRCVDINYQGTINTYRWAKSVGAQYIFSSTDKAVLPINAYGMSKALAEKYLFERGDAAVFRWSNVLGSRGSVLDIMRKCVEADKPFPITDRRMTRFWLTIDDVAAYMWAKRYDRTDEIPHIPPMKAASLQSLLDAVAGIKDYPTTEIGIRPGEKLHEVMLSTHDYCMRSDTHDQYTHAELADLVKRCK